MSVEGNELGCDGDQQANPEIQLTLFQNPEGDVASRGPTARCGWRAPDSTTLTACSECRRPGAPAK